MSVTPRVVLVTRPTHYEMLLARHATREQARFFLEARGQRIAELEEQNERFERARCLVLGAIPTAWRSARVDRDRLDRFLFEDADVVVALGQDGLVANVAKYLRGQIVVGIDPDPGINKGVLVRHDPSQAEELLLAAIAPRPDVEERTLVQARLDDGQRIIALNEIFLGHASHQTARYRLDVAGEAEQQMSSGMIVATGTGSTGWAASICRGRTDGPELPGPSDAALAFLVREAFQSPVSGVRLIAGRVDEDASLTVTSEMDEGGVIFGDGLEADRVEFGFGTRAELRVAEERLRLLA